ncbi:hypothetical protein [Sunxiuqinia sp. sy24]|uniref:hypothetical protein n=1 Tax=Sunxiuqinia sp. sy24 TaxID=3461495 RepID=UPI0040465E4B
MKKLVFLFALVFAVSMAMGQHTDVVNQTGNNNVSHVDQWFDGSGTALDGNEAYVDQIGDRNSADVDQWNNGYAGSAHWAKIHSDGNDNTGKIYQENDKGDAIIWQDGNTNWANIFQSGNFGTGTPLNPTYDAFAKQVGNSNVITIDVWATNATAYAEQVGNNNHIDQDMGSGYGEKVKDSHFDARQFGDRNTAIQMMEGQGFSGGVTALGNMGSIYQDGNDNTAIQKMYEDGATPAAGNYANAYQMGNTNWSEQNQTGMSNSSTHSQIGNFNVEVTNQN